MAISFVTFACSVSSADFVASAGIEIGPYHNHHLYKYVLMIVAHHSRCIESLYAIWMVQASLLFGLTHIHSLEHSSGKCGLHGLCYFCPWSLPSLSLPLLLCFWDLALLIDHECSNSIFTANSHSFVVNFLDLFFKSVILHGGDHGFLLLDLWPFVVLYDFMIFVLIVMLLLGLMDMF